MTYQARTIPQEDAEAIARGINLLTQYAHDASAAAGWWRDPHTGEPLDPREQFGTKVALIHSEVSEALEGERKGLADDKLPHRPMAEVEFGDTFIRIGDLAGAMGYDIGWAVVEKMDFNAVRADHKLENRAAAGGKRF